MKVFSIVTLFLSSVIGIHGLPKAAFQVRGGAKLGPLDASMALDLSKAATTAYAAASASKYINKQVEGKDSELENFLTGELFQLHALITTVACGMFGLLDPSFADIKVIAIGSLIALGIKLSDAGVSTDSLKENALQAAIAVLLTVIAFVD